MPEHVSELPALVVNEVDGKDLLQGVRARRYNWTEPVFAATETARRLST